MLDKLLIIFVARDEDNLCVDSVRFELLFPTRPDARYFRAESNAVRAPASAEVEEQEFASDLTSDRGSGITIVVQDLKLGLLFVSRQDGDDRGILSC